MYVDKKGKILEFGLGRKQLSQERKAWKDVKVEIRKKRQKSPPRNAKGPESDEMQEIGERRTFV